MRLLTHPKITALKRKLNLSSRYEAVGVMNAFWGWVLMEGPKAYNIGGYAPQYIADSILWESDANALIDAIRDVGFIDSDGNVHEWAEHEGQYWKKREKNAELQANKRARDREEREKNAPVMDVSCMTPLLLTEPDKEPDGEIYIPDIDYYNPQHRETALALLTRLGMEGNLQAERQLLDRLRVHGESTVLKAYDEMRSKDNVKDPLKYLFGILDNWSKGVGAPTKPPARNVRRDYEQRTYTKEQDDALFTNMFPEDSPSAPAEPC